MKSIAQLVDTKTGNADFSRNQQVVADDVAAGKAVTPVGDKAANAGCRIASREMLLVRLVASPEM